MLTFPVILVNSCKDTYLEVTNEGDFALASVEGWVVAEEPVTNWEYHMTRKDSSVSSIAQLFRVWAIRNVMELPDSTQKVYQVKYARRPIQKKLPVFVEEVEVGYMTSPHNIVFTGTLPVRYSKGQWVTYSEYQQSNLSTYFPSMIANESATVLDRFAVERQIPWTSLEEMKSEVLAIQMSSPIDYWVDPYINYQGLIAKFKPVMVTTDGILIHGPNLYNRP